MKIGRNAPCPCGSGKKYKKCCLNNDQQTERMHSYHNGFIQLPPRETSHKIPQDASGIRIRPYMLAKMCDPTEKHVQEIFLHHPEQVGIGPWLEQGYAQDKKFYNIYLQR